MISFYTQDKAFVFTIHIQYFPRGIDFACLRASLFPKLGSQLRSSGFSLLHAGITDIHLTLGLITFLKSKGLYTGLRM